ncbi:hypothetical protein XM38_046100 [Halomicronema hongdechloris C2206]|uniref:Response regulatory domain-containing protein n=1 Tax=Halomicronema hongdechloris C2206 TaxID=1641165 RepID=A0A1Z3HTL0_9CYAN|nr:DUF3685 domain-containing protein [Halomicronema hongdechloris]ASC73639.1 hypothetical protein XM38_046100 [Halomicronema hongdechloris C2206]
MTSPLRLMLINDDPVFRLGLRIWLEQLGDIQVVAEASNASEAWTQLSPSAAAAEVATEPALDLVILDLGLGRGDPQQLPGLQLCGQIKSRFPTLPVLVLGASDEPVLRAAADQMGADAYQRRGLPLHQLADLIGALATAPTSQTASALPADRQSPPTPGPGATFRSRLRQSCLQQIAASLDQVQGHLDQASAPYRWVLAGRRRELRAARGLISWLLATPTPEPQPSRPQGDPQAPSSPFPSPGLVQAPGGTLQGWPRPLLQAVALKLTGPLANTSGVPLEIDILRQEKRQELLYLSLQQLEATLRQLRRAQLSPEQVTQTWLTLLGDLWQDIMTEFLGRYTTLEIDQQDQSLVQVLSQERETVQQGMLATLPYGPDLLRHLLFQDSLTVDGAPYLASTPAALDRSQWLLENLVIQLANAVIQPLLNRCPDVEPLKQQLYHRRLISSREIERFRNELAWRYRWASFWHEPAAIFESRYPLWGLGPSGLVSRSIYAPRRQELEQLSGLPLVITLLLEARDAIAPRFRAVVAWVGSGLVYILTEVIGRGIGLIGRGIAKGIGTAWQDRRFNRHSQDS